MHAIENAKVAAVALQSQTAAQLPFWERWARRDSSQLLQPWWVDRLVSLWTWSVCSGAWQKKRAFSLVSEQCGSCYCCISTPAEQSKWWCAFVQMTATAKPPLLVLLYSGRPGLFIESAWTTGDKSQDLQVRSMPPLWPRVRVLAIVANTHHQQTKTHSHSHTNTQAHTHTYIYALTNFMLFSILAGSPQTLSLI